MGRRCAVVAPWRRRRALGLALELLCESHLEPRAGAGPQLGKPAPPGVQVGRRIPAPPRWEGEGWGRGRPQAPPQPRPTQGGSRTLRRSSVAQLRPGGAKPLNLQPFHQLTIRSKPCRFCRGQNTRVSAISCGFNPRATQNTWEICGQPRALICTVQASPG